MDFQQAGAVPAGKAPLLCPGAAAGPDGVGWKPPSGRVPPLAPLPAAEVWVSRPQALAGPLWLGSWQPCLLFMETERGASCREGGGNTATRINSKENGLPLGRWDGEGGGNVPIAPVRAVGRWLTKLLPLQLQRQKYEPELGEYE